MSTEFAISPAYFDFTSYDESEKEHNESRIYNWIHTKMPLTAQSNERMFGIFRMCVAALMYYDGLLKERLHCNSIARTSIFLTETIPLSNFLTTKYPCNKMSATEEYPTLSYYLLNGNTWNPLLPCHQDRWPMLS